MSSSKGGKRISVFDRLGPGNDEAPPSHRRSSSEKSRHAYGPLAPAPHVRDDLPIRQRKPSHSEYEDKHLHYRDGAPPPPPRLHHRGLPPGDYPVEIEDEGPRRSSVSGPPSQPPPPLSRKTTRDVPEGHKTDRSGSSSKTRTRTSSSMAQKLPVDQGGGSGSDFDSGGEEGERKRRRSYQDSQRRSKHGGSESVGVPAEEDIPRRGSKHLERKEKAGSVGIGDVPLSVGGSAGVGGAAESKKRVRKEGSTSAHKRRKEEDYSESAIRAQDRKRKRDDEDLSTPVESKKVRMSSSDYHSSVKDAERVTSSRSRGEGGEGERKRRHDSANSKDESSRKYPRLSSPEVPSGNSSGKRHSSRSITSPSNKKNDHRKDRKLGSIGSNESTEDGLQLMNEGEAEASSKSSQKKAALDWLTVNSYTRRATAKLEQRPKSALKKFTPGAIFSEIGVSPLLAGKECYSKISSTVSAHLTELQEERNAVSHQPDLPCVTQLPESVLENPFGNAEFASAGVSRIKEQVKWTRLIPDSIGACRRALTAAADFSLRKKLRKTNQRQFLPQAQPQPTNWDSEHYSTAVALYQSLGKKASGKPAYRLQPSKVGTLLVAR